MEKTERARRTLALPDPRPLWSGRLPPLPNPPLHFPYCLSPGARDSRRSRWTPAARTPTCSAGALRRNSHARSSTASPGPRERRARRLRPGRRASPRPAGPPPRCSTSVGRRARPATPARRTAAPQRRARPRRRRSCRTPRWATGGGCCRRRRWTPRWPSRSWPAAPRNSLQGPGFLRTKGPPRPESGPGGS